MILVYVAGPYRALNVWDVEQNIRRAEQLAFEVWKLGAVAVTPHLLGRHLDKVLPDEHMLAAGRALLRLCNVMVVTENWHHSEGTKAEMVEAAQAGIPCFSFEHLKTWLRGRGIVPFEDR